MLRVLIALLTLAAAVIHFKFFIKDTSGGLIYGLNGLGYLGLLGLAYLPVPFLENLHGIARWLLILYTAITIISYVVFGIMHKEWTVPLGPVTVLIEVILIVLLLLDGRDSVKAPAATSA